MEIETEENTYLKGLIQERERERYATVSNWLEEMENIYLNNYSVYGCIVLKLVEYDLMHIVFNIMYSKL